VELQHVSCTCPTHIIEAQNPRYTEAGTSVYLHDSHSMVKHMHNKLVLFSRTRSDKEAEMMLRNKSRTMNEYMQP
jgi:hypothetical protein